MGSAEIREIERGPRPAVAEAISATDHLRDDANLTAIFIFCPDATGR